MIRRSQGNAARPSGGRDADPGSFSVIAHGVELTGDIVAASDIQLNGTVSGNVRCTRLVLGEQGRIRGSVEADEVKIAGAVEGPISAARVVLVASAQVTGSIRYGEINIELGARLDGELHWRSGEAEEGGLKLVS
jgi:cytoskeletal protein CcmA (bactofilin family)